ncbi:MAG: electron transfer flavoprotein subunit beta/FixA family protein [Elusimicrobia bacterium]|nr:electron transfer flavoprotein subunit beta/FixA family protein [Elusimicrobiota bacterium]
MKILICVKQVPSSENVKFDEKGNMIREGCECELNKCDDYALQNALYLKSKIPDLKISVLTMGPPKAADILKYCVSRGADEAYMLSGDSLKGADTLITAKALAAACREIEKLSGKIDLYFFGDKSSDGETGHVPAQFAQMKNLPAAYFLDEIISIDSNGVEVISKKEGTEKVFKLPVPCVLSFKISAQIEIKLPSIAGKMKAKKYSEIVLKPSDLSLDFLSAQDASPTWVGKCHEIKSELKQKETKLSNSTEIAQYLKKELKI